MKRVRARWVEFLGCRLRYTVVTHTGVRPLRVPSCACIVGALSAGHIIESGDNANGEYIRFADGTQVCCGTTVISCSASSAYVAKECTFPAAFTEVFAAVSCRHISVDNGGLTRVVNYTETEIILAAGAVRGSTFGSTGNAVADYIAIGKWK